MSADRMPTGRGIAQLSTVPDSERRDGGPELVRWGPSTGCSRFACRRYPGGSTCDSIFSSVRQLRLYSWQAARFDNSPVRTRRRTSVHISMSAYTPRASPSVGGNRGSAAILLTDIAAQLCAAFFDRPGYPAARCTFRPAFTEELWRCKSREGKGCHEGKVPCGADQWESISARNSVGEQERLTVRERLAAAAMEYLPAGSRVLVYG